MTTTAKARSAKVGRGRAKPAAKPAAKPRKRYSAELKTKVSDANVETFVAAVSDERQRADSFVILELLRKATKQAPKMWGGAIVGFGDYHYVGKSGREGDWFVCGFSPRKGTMTLYMLGGWAHDAALLTQLGKHSLGGGCLYIKSLDGVDLGVLKQLIASSLARAKRIKDSGLTVQG